MRWPRCMPLFSADDIYFDAEALCALLFFDILMRFHVGCRLSPCAPPAVPPFVTPLLIFQRCAIC